MEASKNLVVFDFNEIAGSDPIVIAQEESGKLALFANSGEGERAEAVEDGQMVASQMTSDANAALASAQKAVQPTFREKASERARSRAMSGTFGAYPAIQAAKMARNRLEK